MPLIEISDLAFPAFNKKELEKIPNAYGLELFYEFGSNAYWDSMLAQLDGSHRSVSVHGPCETVNLADPADQNYLARYEETFSYAGKCGASFVVVHTNEHWQGNKNSCQQLVKERLHTIEALSQRMQGAGMTIENVGLHAYNLFDYDEYIKLLAEFPTAKALVDVGHGHVNGWDLCSLVKALGPRIAAFHLHDNDGCCDQHLPIGMGTIEWPKLMKAIQTYAPQAVWVLEYANGTCKTGESLLAHIEKLRSNLAF